MKATVTPSLLPFSAGSVRISAQHGDGHDGVERDPLGVDAAPQAASPGTAPSRLNAYIMREALVMQLMPQKNCPTTQMMRIVFVQAAVIALSNTANTVPPPSLTAFASPAANVIASRTM